MFAISWRNSGQAQRDTSLDAYHALGVMAVLAQVAAICGPGPVQGVAYCLGGTLLAITAATLARDGDTALALLTLLTAQTDFTEPGELQLFTTEDELDFLDCVMATKGYLDCAQMVGTFGMLRPNDLIWGHAIRDYLMGGTGTPSPLMAWNTNATRMLARKHIEYLRRSFLDNDLAEGRFEVTGHLIVLGDIHLPLFMVGTEHDNVAPWRSVYKLHGLDDGPLTFILTSCGHNAGIVSEPGHARPHFRQRMRAHGQPTLGPDDWLRETTPQDGS